jgi:hypothetical protein
VAPHRAVEVGGALFLELRRQQGRQGHAGGLGRQVRQQRAQVCADSVARAPQRAGAEVVLVSRMFGRFLRDDAALQFALVGDVVRVQQQAVVLAQFV